MVAVCCGVGMAVVLAGEAGRGGLPRPLAVVRVEKCTESTLIFRPRWRRGVGRRRVAFGWGALRRGLGLGLCWMAGLGVVPGWLACWRGEEPRWRPGLFGAGLLLWVLLRVG